jgi:hypothetical protein
MSRMQEKIITNKSFKNMAEFIYLGLIQIKTACMKKSRADFKIQQIFSTI